MPLGDRLIECAREVNRQVRLISPFVKVDTLTRVLRAIPAGVPVEVCTRWRPDEIAAGVSDLAVWDVCNDAENVSLRLCDRLHAKAYVFDDFALIGSANLTATALGWRRRPNIELLEGVPAISDSVVQLLAVVDLEAVPATQTLHDLMQELVADLPPFNAEECGEEDSLPYGDSSIWLPTLRDPGLLFQAYVGDFDDMTTASAEESRRDLRALSLPAGLREEQFRKFVAVVMLARPPFDRLDAFLESPRVFGEVVGWIREFDGNATTRLEGQEAWQTLMRWLLYFLPLRYERRVFRHSEVMARRGCFEDDRHGADEPQS